MKYKSTPVSKIKYMNMKNNRDKTLISVMGRTQKEWEQKAAFRVTPVPVMMGRDQCSIGCTSQSVAQITIRSRMIPLLLVQGCWPGPSGAVPEMSPVIQERQHCASQTSLLWWRLERRNVKGWTSLSGLVDLEVCDEGIDWAEPLPAWREKEHPFSLFLLGPGGYCWPLSGKVHPSQSSMEVPSWTHLECI